MQNRPTLMSADTLKIVAACKAEAQKNKWAMCIAVADAAGTLVHFERMDGSLPVSVEAAQGKAKASALMRAPSSAIAGILNEYPGAIGLPGLLVAGAVPLMYQGECVGAVAASGAAGHEDEQVAKAGAATLA